MFHHRICLIVLALAAVTGLLAGAAPAKGPWPADVPGFVKPAPGEHPRLLFRKGDIVALKAKAATPEGKAIIARLRLTLGGNGETFPTKFSPAT